MSGVPYLGSKISLISKSAIRYEGILVDVNPQESTITFEQVRFFGTEGRRPGNEIPAMDKIFECVVFRSADIEDLQVYEEAPAPAAKSVPAILDPAVVSSVEAKDEVVRLPPRNYASALNAGNTSTSGASYNQSQAQSGSQAKPRSFSTAASGQSYRPAHNQQQQYHHQPRPAKVVVPDSEYDFSSANARFSKDAIDETVETQNAPSYNKHASFFDDISCQAKEQQTGERGERNRHERDLNIETFGQAAPYRRYNNTRGRGRGGRGGYQYQQQRGGYNNYNGGYNRNYSNNNNNANPNNNDQ